MTDWIRPIGSEFHRHERPSTSGSLDEHRRGPSPRNRKFLLMSPDDHPLAVWIDDDGSCLETRPGGGPVCRGGDNHLIEGEFRQKWAWRCPKSLSKLEQERVFWDQPPGAGAAKVKEYLAFVKEMRGGK